MCGGSASGKSTVARKIIEELDVPWVTLLSLDSFYKVIYGILWDHLLNAKLDMLPCNELADFFGQT